ncbi:MAG: 3-dehydroquinate synthase [Candidatus Coatesbacteria bacterium]|nr:3-dehydroquinate synthase [Candidatus Coatesbacteria bacterium]
MKKYEISFPKQETRVITCKSIHYVREIRKVFPDKTELFLLTDRNVFSLYNEHIRQFINSFSKLIVEVIPPGERSKNMSNLKKILNKLAEKGFSRNTLFVTMGGGVIGDIGGLSASIYMRGVDLIHIPTTLLSQIDSAFGGKTAVNLSYGKNLAGSFHNAKLILLNNEYLTTHNNRLWIEGLAEMIKYAVGFDKMLFLELEDFLLSSQNFNEVNWDKWIEKCYKLKMSICLEDPDEKSNRVLLNIGHTIGHALEKLKQFRLSHGKSVLFGIIEEAKISRKFHFLSIEEEQRIVNLINSREFLKIRLRPSLESITANIKWDKKRRDINMLFPVIDSIGSSHIEYIKLDKLIKLILSKD